MGNEKITTPARFSDLTYILGAGASCKAMPLVENFNSRFGVFTEYINSDNRFKRNNLAGEVMDFKRNVDSHASFDTYFKKLFHQGIREEIISKNKKILLLFFLFEHFFDANQFESNITYRRLKAEGKEKKLNLDPRYDALIAGLLKPVSGKAEFYCNVNFITWNYDMNLLFALKNFISPTLTFTEFINQADKGSYFQVSNQVKVIHMNGYVYHHTLDQYNEQNIFDLFPNIINEYFEKDTFDKYASYIQFAWEDKKMDIKIIQQIINNSKTIVMIGYSLPLYNRLIDVSYLNFDNLFHRNLVLQDLNPKNIGDLLETDFELVFESANNTSGASQLKLIDNCNSFYIPNSLLKL